MEEELSAIHLRLAKVYIENKSYEDPIACSRPETFFYLDPSYYGCENDYGDGIFPREDFRKLSDILKPCRGGNSFFQSTIAHRPCAIFKGFRIASVKTKYASGAWTGKSKTVTELLISNF